MSATESVAVFTIVWLPLTVRFPDTTTSLKVTLLVVLTACGNERVRVFPDTAAVIPVPPVTVSVSEARVMAMLSVPSVMFKVLPEAAIWLST